MSTDASVKSTVTIAGEIVRSDDLARMEWIPFNEAFDRLEAVYFLARFCNSEKTGDNLAYCCTDEDGNVYALHDEESDGGLITPHWMLSPEPDYVLVRCVP